MESGNNEAVRKALKSRTFFMALLLAGCAGGLQSSLAAQTAPAVIFTNPSSDATSVPTSINSSKQYRDRDGTDRNV
jgi:hypothetical protein